MVGEGVLLECLSNPDVAQVLVVNRKPGGISHPKLQEVIHKDFFDLSSIETRLAGYNACFFCLGISSVGVDKEEYKHITYDLTLNFAGLLAKINPDMTFCYVTGSGTDSTEKKGMAWARVKGAIENALMQLREPTQLRDPSTPRFCLSNGTQERCAPLGMTAGNRIVSATNLSGVSIPEPNPSTSSPSIPRTHLPAWDVSSARLPIAALAGPSNA